LLLLLSKGAAYIHTTGSLLSRRPERNINMAVPILDAGSYVLWWKFRCKWRSQCNL